MAVKLPLNEPEERARQADFDLIRDLAALLEETGLSEIEIGDGPERVRVARTVQSAVASAAAAAAEPLSTEAADVSTPVNIDSSHPGAVISPLVGVAYNAPEPGAEPFTKVGEQVSEGQTLFIVEAMKTMNHIPAPRAGTVKRILVGDGDAVEFGAPLVILE